MGDEMTDRPKLSVLNAADPGAWVNDSDDDARQTLESILTEYDRVVVIGVRRSGRGEVEYFYSVGRREHAQTSQFELTGSMHFIVRALEDDIGDGTV
jgi:hypothetical protein